MPETNIFADQILSTQVAGSTVAEIIAATPGPDFQTMRREYAGSIGTTLAPKAVEADGITGTTQQVEG